VRDPGELVQYLTGPEGGAPVLVETLEGFIDAGQAVRLAREHLLGLSEPELVARIDIDELLDHRARRPTLVFDTDHWESYDRPQVRLQRLRDAAGTPFLLLSGPEPDVQWERFAASVIGMLERLGVRLTIGLHSVPWAVSHTRPVGITGHGNPRELLESPPVDLGKVQVPASIGHLLEYRLGELGRQAIGFAAHTPYYVAAIEYAASAERLLASVERVAGLSLELGPLRLRAEEVRAAIDTQLAEDEQAQAVISELEERDEEPLDAEELPSGDELGAEFERFLAERGRQADES
jgi:hypothetical protein